MPGGYAGFAVEEKPGASDNRYIHSKSVGVPG
jgi:hypothetical protein